MKKLFIFILFISSITKQTQAQIITTVAGNGTGGYTGDGGFATAAGIHEPWGVTSDILGNLYISDNGNNAIRKVNTAGIISTFAGGGTSGLGDGGQATAAEISGPTGIIFDANSNLYIVDNGNNVIRKVNSSGIITTFAGNGISGFSGDGGQATNAEIYLAQGIAVDATGNLYIADENNLRIRVVNTLGIINTIAGNGTPGYGGDGGQATAAQLGGPTGVTIDTFGNIFIADQGSNCIRKVNTLGIISTIAGNGTSGFSGDEGEATNAELAQPSGAVFDINGNLYISDSGNNRIRMINTLGIINSVVGNGYGTGIGTGGFSGDGGQAINAELYLPLGLALDASCNLYIADWANTRVRKVNNICGYTTNINKIVGNKEQVNIYPNPSTGIFAVAYTNSIDELKVSNMLGQVVYEAKPQTNKTTLALANEGVYFITVTSGTSISTQKVVVQH